MNASKTWSRTPAPVRKFHFLLNSSRVPSYFRRVLDSFKHDGFLRNFMWNLLSCDWIQQPQSGKLMQYYIIRKKKSTEENPKANPSKAELSVSVLNAIQKYLFWKNIYLRKTGEMEILIVFDLKRCVSGCLITSSVVKMFSHIFKHIRQPTGQMDYIATI